MLSFRYIIGLIVLLSSTIYAQQIPHQNVLRFQFNEVDTLPKRLLQQKSVVFIYEADNQRNWKAHAKKIHPFFYKAGLDVTAYYQANDVYSSPGITAAFFEEMRLRDIRNILILDLTSPYSLYVFPFPKSPYEPLSGIKARKLEEENLSELGDLFYKTAYHEELVKKNYLVLDIPEFIDLVPYIKGKRHERYDPDVKIDKLAVPYFSTLGQQLEKDSILADTKRIMEKHYPFRYELLAGEIGNEEELVRTKGTPYILYMIYGHGSSLKNMMGYKSNSSETMYITFRKGGEEQMVKWNADDLVFKFYMKHVYSNNYYYGSQWDADSDWQQALINFIENMKVDLKVK
jgi:hypothetical protein